MRALSFDPAMLETFVADHGAGFEPVTLPAGLFGGQEEPAQTLGTNTILFAGAEMPDETAYAIVKQLWENREELYAAHSLLRYMTPETVGQGMVVPVHPGARKYFDEQGITVSDSKLDA